MWTYSEKGEINIKIITISAKAQHGKDFVASLIKERIEQDGERVLITHFADLLKYICKTFFNWDGNKDESGRTQLQHIGTDVIRHKNPDYWVDFLKGIFKMFDEEWDYVIIPDTRFPNENDNLKDAFELVTLRVERPDFDNGLTDEQKTHDSETALDNYVFDYKIINPGNEEIDGEISKFMIWLKEGRE